MLRWPPLHSRHGLLNTLPFSKKPNTPLFVVLSQVWLRPTLTGSVFHSGVGTGCNWHVKCLKRPHPFCGSMLKKDGFPSLFWPYLSLWPPFSHEPRGATTECGRNVQVNRATVDLGHLGQIDFRQAAYNQEFLLHWLNYHVLAGQRASHFIAFSHTPDGGSNNPSTGLNWCVYVVVGNASIVLDVFFTVAVVECWWQVSV